MAQYTVYRPWASDPWRDFSLLRREMNTLFDRLGRDTATAQRGAYPPVNLYENEEGFVLACELPGISAEDIEVKLEASKVTLRGERKIDHAVGDNTAVHRLERQAGQFQRSFELPSTIDGDKVEAAHRNGVLMIKLPKANEHRARQIAVQGS